MLPKVTVSLSKRTLTAQLVGQEGRVYPAGIGRPETPSPLGLWRVIDHRREVSQGISVEVLVLNTPREICLRGHPDLASIGRASSGG